MKLYTVRPCVYSTVNADNGSQCLCEHDREVLLQCSGSLAQAMDPTKAWGGSVRVYSQCTAVWWVFKADSPAFHKFEQVRSSNRRFQDGTIHYRVDGSCETQLIVQKPSNSLFVFCLHFAVDWQDGTLDVVLNCWSSLDTCRVPNGTQESKRFGWVDNWFFPVNS